MAKRHAFTILFDDHLKPERVSHIASEARRVWYGYIQQFPERLWEKEVQDFLQPITANHVAVKLFQLCSEQKTQHKGTGVAPTRSLGNLVGHGFEGATIPNGPSSWLWSDPGGIPRVLIDVQVIQTQHNAYRHKVVRRLVLHEAGHVVLHWDKLSPPKLKTGAGAAIAASPVQEAEAWFFAMCVEGLALASFAYKSKSDPPTALDPTWPHA